VVEALKLSRRVKEARRVVIYVFSMIKKMLLKTLKCCRNAIRDVGQFAASLMVVCGSRRDSRTV
jgi:hypothetical protein